GGAAGVRPVAVRRFPGRGPGPLPRIVPHHLRLEGPGAGAGAGRGERPALPDPADRQLPEAPGRARPPARGVPVRRRARLPRRRGADPADGRRDRLRPQAARHVLIFPRGRAEAPSAPGFTRSKAGQSLHRPPVSNGRQGAGPPPGCSTDVDRGDHVTRLLRAHARARALVRHALGRRRPAVHGPVFRAAALLTGLAAATTTLAATTARAAA